MKMLRRVSRNSRIFLRSHRGLFVALFVALLGSFCTTQHAMAGGPIMIGTTYISGTDRATGTTYKDPTQLFTNNLTSHILPAYPGDTVTFYAHIQNWDPLPIPGPVNVQIHKVGFTGSDTLASDGEKDTTPIGPSGYWWYKGGNIFQLESWNEKVTGPGSNTPGNQLCYYVQTNPTVYDFTNVLLFTDPVIEGLHKFNVNPDHFHLKPGLFFDTVFLGIFNNIQIGNPMSCVQIAYNYNLVPSITLTNPGGVQSGGPVDVAAAVDQTVNGEHATYTKKTQWQITQVIIPDDATKPHPNGGTSSQVPCNKQSSAYFYNTTGVSCKVVAKSGTGSNGSADTIFNADGSFKSGSSFPTSLPSPGNLPDGTIVCYALSVSPYAPYLTGSTTWRHSALVCPPGSLKKPKVQILGDDVRVGGKIDTSQTVGSLAKLFGSWGQYASYSVGDTVGFGTASGLKGGIPGGTPQSDWSTLTFANAQSNFGHFSSSVASKGSTGVQQLFTQKAKTSDAKTPLDLSDLSGSTTPYLFDNKGKSPLVIKGGTIGKGKTLIIVATGTVTIKGDITYTSASLSSLKNIPQVVIVAHDINIDDSVHNIDAWLIADSQTGTINTCDLAPAQTLTTKICNEPLRVNGPVVTNKLLLNRTYGSDDATPDVPAETFDNNGTAYLWAANYLSNNSNIVTTNQIELPPRY